MRLMRVLQEPGELAPVFLCVPMGSRVATHQHAAVMPTSRANVGTNSGDSSELNNHTTVVSSNMPIAFLNVSIHMPGRGRKRTRPGNAPTSK